MNRIILMLIIILFLSACASNQVEETSPPEPTIVSPTLTAITIPPTETAIPATPTPNPHAKDSLLAFAEAMNNLEIEKAMTLFSEDIRLATNFWIFEGFDGIEGFINEMKAIADYNCEFTGFEVDGDTVDFTWNQSFTDHSPPMPDRQIKETCKASAIMVEDIISYIRVSCPQH